MNMKAKFGHDKDKVRKQFRYYANRYRPIVSLNRAADRAQENQTPAWGCTFYKPFPFFFQYFN
jgi:hypothetical protein